MDRAGRHIQMKVAMREPAGRSLARIFSDIGMIPTSNLAKGRPYNAAKGSLRWNREKRGLETPLGPRMLIVDDEAYVHRSLKRLAKAAGFREQDVVCASDGEEALQKLEKEKFSIIVLDWRMKVLGGGEVIRRLLGMGRADLVKQIFVYTGTPEDLKEFPFSKELGGRVLVKEADPQPMRNLFRLASERRDISEWHPPR
jgi:CheY-like chemotaxis protein